MRGNPHNIYSPKHPSPHGMLTRYITVKNQFIGFHQYDDAPEEVAFLKNLHRHVFKVESLIEVRHDDRELEFFMVQENIEREIIPFLRVGGPLGSCEMIAENILWGLINKYGDDRYAMVEVYEDGENAGSAIWSPRN